MFETLVYVLLILIWPLCLFLVGLVLLQGGAGDMSSAFGGGGQLDSTLGVGAGRKMSKLTGWLVFAFLAIVTILAIPHGSIAKRAAESAARHGGATNAVSAPPAGEQVPAPPPAVVEPPSAPVEVPAPVEPAAPSAPPAPAPAAPAPVPATPPSTEPAPTEPVPAAPPVHAPSQLRAE